MNRPLKEHFEVPTDVDVALRTFDYIEELEKYIDYLEALRQPDVISSVCPKCNSKDTRAIVGEVTWQCKNCGNVWAK